MWGARYAVQGFIPGAGLSPSFYADHIEEAQDAYWEKVGNGEEVQLLKEYEPGKYETVMQNF